MFCELLTNPEADKTPDEDKKYETEDEEGTVEDGTEEEKKSKTKKTIRNLHQVQMRISTREYQDVCQMCLHQLRFQGYDAQLPQFCQGCC